MAPAVDQAAVVVWEPPGYEPRVLEERAPADAVDVPAKGASDRKTGKSAPNPASSKAQGRPAPPAANR